MKDGAKLRKKLKLLALTLILISSFGINVANSEVIKEERDSFKYYEDLKGELKLNQIRALDLARDYKTNHGSEFSFGSSKSTYWIRIPLNALDQEQYISIYNPTVTKSVLYLPVRENGKVLYRQFNSGLSFEGQRRDKGFLYPVYELSQDTDYGEVAFIELSSKFTQNYDLKFLNKVEFDNMCRDSFALYGILFGILLMAVIHSIIIFIQLRDRAHLYYAIYIIAMTIYQACLTGVYSVYFPEYSDVIVSKTITISLLVMVSFIFFFKSFFKIKDMDVKCDLCINLLLGAVILGILISMTELTTFANFYSHWLALLGALLLLGLTFKAHKHGLRQTRLFVIGWGIMIAGLAVSVARHIGILPNNSFTINISLIAVCFKSILMSTALVERIKVLTEEREKTMIKYKEAEANASANEMAFLRAQIRPHFLYNTLNVIVSLCRIEPEKARELILDLAEFLRHNFDFNQDQEWVSLEEEIKCVRAYVRIEQARFRGKIEFRYELDGMNTSMKLPPLTLQPLVENAIVHGIRKKKGFGRVVLRIIEEESCHRIEVEDDGSGMTVEKVERLLSEYRDISVGVGIQNINKRIKKLYGEGIKIKSDSNLGTLVSFKINKGAGL